MELVLDNKIIFNNKRINIGLPITFGLIGIGFLLGKLTKKVCNFGKNQEIEAKKDNDIAKDVTESVVTNKEILSSYSDQIYLMNPNNAKILVVGWTNYKTIALLKKLDEIEIDRERVEILNDIEKIKNDSNLLNSIVKSKYYTDIIVGPMPHSMCCKNDNSSLITKLEDNEKENVGPRIIRALANNELKITKTSFEKAIKQTYLYNKIKR